MRPYYVTMTDADLSCDMTYKLVICCDTIEQAETIRRCAANFPEMRRIKVSRRKPRYNEDTHCVEEKHFSSLGDGWFIGEAAS